MLENLGKMSHFSFTYEKVNTTDSLQPSGSNGPLVNENVINYTILWLKEQRKNFNIIKMQVLRYTQTLLS